MASNSAVKASTNAQKRGRPGFLLDGAGLDLAGKLATTGATDPFGDGDPVVRIWDPATGTQLRQFDTGHPGRVEQVRIAPDSDFLVTVGSNSAVFWIAAEDKVTMLRIEGNISSSTLWNHGAVLFIGGTRGLFAFQLIAI